MATKHKTPKKGRHSAPKAVLNLPDLHQAKSAVLKSLSSPDAQRWYKHAIDEFVEWFRAATVVQPYGGPKVSYAP